MRSYSLPSFAGHRANVMYVGDEVLVWSARKLGDLRYVLRADQEQFETVKTVEVPYAGYLRSALTEESLHRRIFPAMLLNDELYLPTDTYKAAKIAGADHVPPLEVVATLGPRRMVVYDNTSPLFLPEPLQLLRDCGHVGVYGDTPQERLAVFCSRLNESAEVIVMAGGGRIEEVRTLQTTRTPGRTHSTHSKILRTFCIPPGTTRAHAMVKLCRDNLLYSIEATFGTNRGYRLSAFCPDRWVCVCSGEFTPPQPFTIEDFDVTATGDKIVLAGVLGGDCVTVFAQLDRDDDDVTVTFKEVYAYNAFNVAFSPDGLTVAALTYAQDAANLTIIDVDV